MVRIGVNLRGVKSNFIYLGGLTANDRRTLIHRRITIMNILYKQFITPIPLQYIYNLNYYINNAICALF